MDRAPGEPHSGAGQGRATMEREGKAPALRPGVTECPMCQGPVRQPRKGRLRIYCCDACKQAAHRRRTFQVRDPRGARLRGWRLANKHRACGDYHG
jgi:hypothetical protein